MADVASREQTHAWDLRGAWAGRRPVVLRLDPDRAQRTRLAGYIEHVSATGAVCVIADVDAGCVDVPCAVILSVRRPHFHEPEDARVLSAAPSRGPTVPEVSPGQLAFALEDARVPPGAP